MAPDPAPLEELNQLGDIQLVRRARAAATAPSTNAARETGRRCIAVVLSRHRATIRAVIAAKVPRDVVDDLESDVFVRFVARVHRGGDITNPAGLLIRIAQRVRADHLDGRRPAASLDAREPAADDPELEHLADEQAIEDLLAPLSERQREAVWLRIVDARPGDEVARKLGTTRGNVDVIVHRALRRLEQDDPR
jgi:RNA polymerase sigma-70 factor, ECF subfamily